MGLESQSDWAEQVFTSVNQICDDLIATGRPGTSPVRSPVGPISYMYSPKFPVIVAEEVCSSSIIAEPRWLIMRCYPSIGSRGVLNIDVVVLPPSLVILAGRPRSSPSRVQFPPIDETQADLAGSGHSARGACALLNEVRVPTDPRDLPTPSSGISRQLLPA